MAACSACKQLTDIGHHVQPGHGATGSSAMSMLLECTHLSGLHHGVQLLDLAVAEQQQLAVTRGLEGLGQCRLATQFLLAL